MDNEVQLKPVTFLLFIFLGLSSAAPAIAQQLLAEFSEDAKFRDIEAHPVGDSVFFSFRMNTGTGNQRWTKQTVWIDSHGGRHDAEFKMTDQPMCGIIRHEADIYYYFFDGRMKDSTLIAMQYNLETKSFQLPKENKFPGRVLGTFIDGDLFVLSMGQGERALKLTQIHRGSVSKETIIKLQFPATLLSRNEVAFIPPGSYPSVSDCKAKVKIYKHGNHVTVIADEMNDDLSVEAIKVIPKTTIYHYNLLEDKTDIYVVSESSPSKFRTYFFEDHLYRVVNGYKKFELKVYDITGKLVTSTQFKKDDEAKNIKIYSRNGKELRVFNSLALYDMLRSYNLTDPSVIVAKGSDGKIVVAWGTYFEERRSLVAGPSIGVLVVSIIGSALLQPMEPPGYSSYFYLQGDPQSGFSLADADINILRAKVDNYEMMHELNGLRFRFKGYVSSPDGVIAIYQLAKEKKLQVVKFTHAH